MEAAGSPDAREDDGSSEDRRASHGAHGRKWCPTLLHSLLLDYRIRHGLSIAVMASLVLTSVVFVDNWYQMSMGTIWTPSGFTTFGRWGKRTHGAWNVPTYREQQVWRCSPEDFADAFWHRQNASLVRWQRGAIAVERGLDPERFEHVTRPAEDSIKQSLMQPRLDELERMECTWATSMADASETFSRDLWIAVGLCWAGLLVLMAGTLVGAKTEVVAAAGLASGAVTLWVRLWHWKWAMEDAFSNAVRDIKPFTGDNIPIEIAAFAAAGLELVSGGLVATFSFQAAHVAIVAFLVSAAILLSLEFWRRCRGCRKSAKRVSEHVLKKVTPIAIKLEKRIVGVSDFDRKNQTYVNKHTTMGQPVKLCKQMPFINALLTFVSDLLRHQQRAFESIGFMHSLVSDLEKMSLERHGVMDQMAQNFLAWRLSVLVLTCFLGVSLLALIPVMVAMRHIRVDEHQQSVYSTGSAVLTNLDSFGNYSQHMMDRAFSVVDIKVMEAEMWLDLAHYCAEAFSVFMCLLGLSCWIYFGTSKKYVVRGWIMLLFAPLCMTMISTRSLVDVQAAELVISEYTRNAVKNFDLKDKVAKCQRLTSKEGLKPHLRTLTNACGTVDSWSPFLGIWLSKSQMTKTQEACKVYIQAQDKGKVSDLIDLVNKTCTKINTALGFSEEDREKRAFIDDVRARLLVSLDVYLSARSALGAYSMMVPAALAFGPGFVRASWKLKLLFPLARLPGTLVVLLPAMYCPLLWMTYQFVFQIIGSRLLLSAFVLISFAPMIYTMIGVIFNIQSPVLSRPRLSRILKHGRFWRIWVQRFGYVLVLIWVALLELGFIDFMGDAKDSDTKKEFKAFLYTRLRNSRMKVQVLRPLAFVLSWGFKFFYTKVAGMDFLIQHLASDFAFERCVEAVVKIPDEDIQNADKLPDGLKGVPVPERIAETRQLEADRRRIGEALVKMTLDVVPERNYESDEEAEDTECAPLGGGERPNEERKRRATAAKRIFNEFAPELADYAGFQKVAATSSFQGWMPSYGVGYSPFSDESYGHPQSVMYSANAQGGYGPHGAYPPPNFSSSSQQGGFPPSPHLSCGQRPQSGYESHVPPSGGYPLHGARTPWLVEMADLKPPQGPAQQQPRPPHF